MAVKKRPTNEEIKGLLLEGNFGSSSDNPLPSSDPLSTTQMILKLAEIKPYDKNPRRERNPKYDEIKASIRSKKTLNNNFNVTRRPGDDLYMIESGGNTRLAILHELYMETADEAFNAIHCLFVPWQSESSVLTSHLIENEMRGDMMLIDKAYAAQELKKELESEADQALSDKNFTQLATESGYKISPKLLRRFNYAIKLDQMIPTVLRSGIGGTRLDFIKKVEKAYREVCKAHQNQFDAAFMEIMSANDTDENFDFDQVRNELDRVLEGIIGIRSNIIYMKVNQIVENNLGNREDVFEPDPEQNLQHISPETSQQLPADNTPVASKPESSGGIKNTAGRNDHRSTTNSNVSQPENINSEAIDTDEDGSITSISNEIQPKNNQTPSPQKDPTKEIKWLRRRGYELALKIAKSRGLEESIMPADNGLGFFIETPVHQLTLPENEGKYHCWWTLFNISEQLATQEHSFCWTYLDIYRRLAEQQKGEEKPNESLSNYIGDHPEPHEIFSALQGQNTDDKAFTDIFRLMENCRKLRSNFSETDLWEQQS